MRHTYTWVVTWVGRVSEDGTCRVFESLGRHIHMNVWCHTYTWVVFCMGESVQTTHVACLSPLVYPYKRVVAHIRKCCGTRVNAYGCVTYIRRRISHIWTCRVRHMNVLCHMYQWVVSCVGWVSEDDASRLFDSLGRHTWMYSITHTNGTHMNVMRRTCPWVVSCGWRVSADNTRRLFDSRGRHIYMNVLCHTCKSVVSCMGESAKTTQLACLSLLIYTYERLVVHIWTCCVRHMNVLCCTYQWVVSCVEGVSEDGTCRVFESLGIHIWMSCVAHMNVWCHTYECVVAHIQMSRVLHGWVSEDDASRLFEFFDLHIWTCSVAHMNVLCQTYECVVSHIRMRRVLHGRVSEDDATRLFESFDLHVWMFYVAHMNVSCQTYECVVSHVSMSRVLCGVSLWRRHVSFSAKTARVACLSLLIYTHEWVVLHIWMCCVTHINGSLELRIRICLCRTYECVVSRVRSHTYECVWAHISIVSWNTHECAASHMCMCLVTPIDESLGKHTWMCCVAHTNLLSHTPSGQNELPNQHCEANLDLYTVSFGIVLQIFVCTASPGAVLISFRFKFTVPQ